MARATLLLALALTACDDGESSSPPATPEDAGPKQDAAVQTDAAVEADPEADWRIEDLVVVPNPSNTLARYVEWRTSAPTATALEVKCTNAAGEVDFDQRYGREDLATEHRVYVMGLYGGADCALTAVAERDGLAVRATEAFTVDAPHHLPALDVQVADVERMQPGWTLINIGNHQTGVPVSAAYIDALGRYRWYRQVPQQHPGSDTEVSQVSDGVMLCGVRGGTPTYTFDWEGNITWSYSNRFMHHDCRFIDEEERVMRYLAITDECPETWSTLIGEYDRVAERTTWRWSLCDHWLPETIGYDWAHSNTIEPFPDENAILLSARNQHTLFKIDRDTGEIEWGLGLKGDFEMKPGSQFWRQHAPEVQPNGNIVIFDNGNERRRPYSRLVELKYDLETMTVERVWEFVPEPRIFAPIWGDADRLPNGNTLGTFGRRRPGKPTHLIEVDADAEEVWHVALPEFWGVYRADRHVPPTYGYVITE